MLANRKLSRHPLTNVEADRSEPSELDRLSAAIHRLADVLESAMVTGLGDDLKPRYKAAPKPDGNLVNEATMAAQLGIPVKTLADYRREGRLPKCWLRNGKRVLWRADETVALWERGIS